MRLPTDAIPEFVKSGSTNIPIVVWFVRLFMYCSGRTGSLEEIQEFQGACHKRFKTKAQEQAFIEDWKESCADVWRSEVKKALDRGLRPKDMKFGTEDILQQPNADSDVADLAEQLN